MKEIVINTSGCGFGLSKAGILRYAKIKGIKLYPYIDDTTKKVYGERATLSNSEIETFLHWSTKPIKNGKILNEDYFLVRDIKRDDPALIQMVKELKKKANGNCSELKIVKILAYVNWMIEEYDGIEHVAEKHRIWN